MLPVVQAVAHCHWNNIVHRDICPDNILVKTIDRENFVVKLTGFELAAILHPNEKLTTLVGSTNYRAPEILDRCYDHKCDVWSCGIVIHELTMGYLPFDGDREEDIVKKIQGTLVAGGGINYSRAEYKKLSLDLLDIYRKFIFA